MANVILFLKHIFPFIITLILWYLAIPFWNPAGILALIPIFYYSFVKPKNNYSLFALIFCFLIDYRCNLLLLWTFLFCLFYAINGFQKYFDVSRMDNDAIHIFLLFTGIGCFILTIGGFTFMNMVNNLWLFAWLGILYPPIVAMNKWIEK
ncbi:MAG: hypothetical protein IKZ49_01685 [Alphaproteobacteria bacterium]|nr:hypothetical protein [Alphaproteobacteria bacterium]